MKYQDIKALQHNTYRHSYLLPPTYYFMFDGGQI